MFMLRQTSVKKAVLLHKQANDRFHSLLTVYQCIVYSMQFLAQFVISKHRVKLPRATTYILYACNSMVTYTHR